MKPSECFSEIPYELTEYTLSAPLSQLTSWTFMIWGHYPNVAAISFVVYNFIKSIFCKTDANCFLDQLYLIGQNALNTSTNRKVITTCNCINFSFDAALCIDNNKTSFFVNSKASVTNIFRIPTQPFSYRPLVTSCMMSLKILCLTHRWQHLWQVLSKGYRWGVSVQDVLVYKIHGTPLKTFQKPWVNWRLGAFEGVNSLTTAFVRIHNSFVISILILLHNQSVRPKIFAYVKNVITGYGFITT